ncbi:pyridoxal phosphate-dependent aminotransferase [Desulfatitalea tepidiphila]|uniref:pyridoxal phosphate-dependent aminotransferase n=1 Tax=Desulfatitalea tepidiphila TaxID=1185843 RepID=UPI0006B54182|nr:pyridoxal phosphate-dependent aminotransferase [Desulfatitalea tepidiphila]
MSVARKISAVMQQSSWIRKMFEEGARLKAKHGADKVFDFSLGNPNLPPPAQFDVALRDAVITCGPGGHCYMPQAGYPQVCDAVADYLASEQGVTPEAADVIMTCGAAGALNVILKALLDPGDEVIVPTPCFVEYRFYVDNHGGEIRMVPTQPDFTLDLEAIAAAINAKTKAVLINSPNNPTGQIYTAESLAALGALLRDKGRELDRTIYLISDEPYRKIVYDGHRVPSIFQAYPESIVATSYSKDLSIPGERIGFAAINPAATYKTDLRAGFALANRILGFVNAPALMQRVVACLQGASVDMGEYKRKRDLLCDGLAAAGYDFVKPPGAFYLFPRTPIADDVAFVRELQEELILAVPGSGFAGPGHFRLAFCVDDQTIVNAMPGFTRVMARYKK